ncbi:MAG TPA: hypothetical protein V6C90_21790 [Coleofasciculaceae cyanobacterium]
MLSTISVFSSSARQAIQRTLEAALGLKPVAKIKVISSKDVTAEICKE